MSPNDPVVVFVDLSNVLRDSSLGQSLRAADWIRWERLRSAVSRSISGSVTYRFIADNNLRSKLSRTDQAKFDAARRRGVLQTSSQADRDLLQDAIAARGMVLSNDRYTDHMRLTGITEVTVLRWATRGRHITLERERLLKPLSVRISERQQKEEKKENWADTEVIRIRWRCRNAACAEGIVPVPNMRRGGARCPACDAFLTDEGEWKAAIEVKILVGDRTVERRILEDGDFLVLGRITGAVELDVSSYIPRAERPHISRRHARLTNDAGRLMVEDLDSTNGTSLLAPADRKLWRRVWMPPRGLRVGETAELAPGHRAQIAKTKVTVERSGRRFGAPH